MNIASFEYVKAISKCGSISKAAESLFITQPALSQSLSKLENELGTKLFVRHGNKMFLTETGAAFLEEGNTILQANSRLLERIDYITKGRKETIRLGLSRFTVGLPSLLEEFVREHPGAQFEITEGLTLELEEKFENGGLDLCIIPSSDFSSKYDHKPLFTEEILLAIPPNSALNQYAEENEGDYYYDLAYLKNASFVSLTSNQRIYDMGIEFCEAAGFTPNILCTVFGYDTLLMLVSIGLGVGFFSSLQYNTIKKMNNPPEYYHLITDRSASRDYVLITKKTLGSLAKELSESIVRSYQR